MGAATSVPKSAIFSKAEQSPDKFKAALANKPLEPAEKPRATQVVATLGPASWTEEMVPEMMKPCKTCH